MNNQVNEVLEKIREVCELGESLQGFGSGEDSFLTIAPDPVQLNHLLLALIKTHGCIETDTQMDNTLMMNEMGTSEYVKYDLTKSVEDNLRSNGELTKWVHGVIIGNVDI